MQDMVSAEGVPGLGGVEDGETERAREKENI